MPDFPLWPACWSISKEIRSQTILNFTDSNIPFFLHTVSYDFVIGACLIQEDRTIASYSYKLNSTERNYSISKQEIIAVIKSLIHFRTFVLGYKITIMQTTKKTPFWKLNHQTEFNDEFPQYRNLIMKLTISIVEKWGFRCFI